MIAFIAGNFHVICFGLLALLIAVRVIRKAIRNRAEAAAKAAAEQAERERAAAKAAAKERTAQQQAAAQAERQRRAAEREAARQEKQAARLAAAKALADEKERALNAEKALRALKAQPMQDDPAPCDAVESTFDDDGILTLAPDEFAVRLAQLDAPKPFAGHVVAFTGTLYDEHGKHVTRKDAIAIVRSLGGKAYESMPAGTTLLVVGKRPGADKLDKADQWISQVTKITPQRFFEMTHSAA